MAEKSGVEWCHHTWSGWWGCYKISPGCKLCYADTFDHRLGGEHWGIDAPRRFFGDDHWKQPPRWDRKAARDGVRRKVFPSMCDPFEDRADLEPVRERWWDLVAATPNLDWLFLTKRPENFAKMLPWLREERGAHGRHLPWPNVWLGVTGENQEEADRRIREMRKIHIHPKANYFVSYEPALERVDFSEHLRRMLWGNDGKWYRNTDAGAGDVGGVWARPVDWIIAGAESGHGARPAQIDWYRGVREQIAAAGGGAAFFLKQHVADKKKISLPVLDGRQWMETP